MIGARTRRPRNVDSLRAAAILYGDWGTSKAYVLGLAFALAGYSSFWLIAAMCCLLALVGLNYIVICQHYPDGGGVYASVRLNKFGVPYLGLIVATVIPAAMVMAIGDVAGLADLYAVGVVGAIATNLGATSTDASLKLSLWQRILMFCTFIVMLAIELTLFVNKPGARVFAGTVLGAGLLLHWLGRTMLQGEHPATGEQMEELRPRRWELPEGTTSGHPILCAARGPGGILDFAIQIAKDMNRPLYILFVREQPALNPDDFRRAWMDDQEACEIFEQAKMKGGKHPILPCYEVSDSAAATIVKVATRIDATHLVLGAPGRNLLLNFIRGNLLRRVSSTLPETIHCIVYT